MAKKWKYYDRASNQWVDVGGGGGGGGTTDYNDLSHKPSIGGVVLSGNKTLAQIGAYAKPSGGIPKTDLASSVQTTLDNAIDKTAQATKTAAMTEPIGIDAAGKLWSVAGGGIDCLVVVDGKLCIQYEV